MTQSLVRDAPVRDSPSIFLAASERNGVNLDGLFNPAAVAIVGASRSTTSISGRLIPVLRDSGYSAAIYPVNPVADSIEGLKAFASLADLPQRPDVVMVVVKAEEALGAVEECVRLRVPYVILHSSGFSETPERRELSLRLHSILAGSTTRLLGPSSEGLIDTVTPIALGFSPAIDPARRSRVIRPGNTVVLSQSGALGFSLADFLSCNSYGVRSVITTGNELDLDIADFLDYFALKPDIGPIVLMLEHLKDVTHFIDAALKLKARGIPVLAFRIGSSAAGQRASLSHAGKMSGSAAPYSSVFAKASVIELRGIDEFLDTMQMVTCSLTSSGGSRVAVVGGSGGAGIWLTDEIVAAGLSVPELSDDLKAVLQHLAAPFASLGNPIDLTAQAVYNGSLPKVLDQLIKTSEVDFVAVVGGFGYSNWIIRDDDVKSVLLSRTKPVIAFSYNVPSQDAVDFFKATNVPFFTDPGRVARALKSISKRSPPARVHRGSVASVSPVSAAPSRRVDDQTLRRLLIENGVRLNERLAVHRLEDVIGSIRSLRFPLVMKIDVPTFVHKTEINAVITNISDERAAVDAAEVLFSRARSLGYDSIAIEPHLRGHEVFVAAVNDAHVGPMIVLGRGGIDVEINADIIHRLLPVNADEAREALEQLAIYPVWRAGFRGTPPANIEALVEFIVAFSNAIAGLGTGGWSEIECNPVIVDAENATAVDLRLVASS